MMSLNPKKLQTDLFSYPLFVYDTLMSGGSKHKKIHRYFYEKAWAYKLDLHVGKKPFAIEGEGIIQGELYWNVDGKTLMSLDKLQGQKMVFERILKPVSTNRMKNINAWVFLFPEAREYPKLDEGNFRPFL